MSSELVVGINSASSVFAKRFYSFGVALCQSIIEEPEKLFRSHRKLKPRDKDRTRKRKAIQWTSRMIKMSERPSMDIGASIASPR